MPASKLLLSSDFAHGANLSMSYEKLEKDSGSLVFNREFREIN